MASSEGHQVAPSVNEESGATKPRVIPNRDVVILRESELDCDLTTAIRRIREDATTGHSRILIVGPDEPEKGNRPDPELPLPQLPMSIGQVARSGGQQALAAAGQRLETRVESLECLLRECGRAIEDVDGATQEGTPVRVKSRIRVLRDVQAWLEATAEDLNLEVRGMKAGFQDVDLFELLTEVRGQVESFLPDLRVNVAPAEGDPHCWGHATSLTEAMFLGIVLTGHRIGGRGSVNVQVARDGDRLVLRILGLGEPVPVAAPRESARFREIVVTRHGGRVIPDSMGPFGTGLVVEIPCAP